MGSEDNGVSPSIIRISDYNAMIPMKGKTGSLNVSVAAGILLYEMSEQH
jgi:23S rRNA (guanosine2251-2'-O)-methyltransferase